MRRLILLLVLALAAAALAPLASARAANANPGVLPVTAKAHGHSYGEWSAAWWQWAYSIPTTANPLLDETGADCAQGQSGHVCFLAGVFNESGDAARSCTIPSGTALFFPVINVECSTLEVGTQFFGSNETELRACAHAFSFTNLEASIDGVLLTDLASYEVDSPLFTFALPADNLLGIPAATGSAVGNGVYLMLAPLSVGEHTLHFGGTYPDFDSFTLSIDYDLTVVPRGRF
jgi:hypothetical protein